MRRELVVVACAIVVLGLVATPVIRSVLARRAGAIVEPLAFPRGPAVEEPRADDWTSYGADLEGSHFASAAGVEATNVENLTPAWSTRLGGPVYGTPIVARGRVFVGDMGHRVTALDAASGVVLWSQEVPGNVSATLAAWQDEVIAVTLYPATLFAFDAATGAPRWNASVAPGASGWGSPIVADGVVYVGASGGDDGLGPPRQRGSVQAFDATNGTLLWRAMTASPSRAGSAVWTTPVVAGDLLIVGTGNGLDDQASDPRTDSIMALNRTTGDLVWWQHYPDLDDARYDDDFGSSPMLVDANGALQVVETQKSGDVRAVDAQTGEVLWDILLPGHEVIGSGARSGNVLALDRSVGDPDVVGIDLQQGQVAWTSYLGSSYSSMAAIPGAFLAVNATGALHAFAADDGTSLGAWQLPGPSSSSPSVAEGKVFVGYDDGVAAFAAR
jgi:outer membrane protein assembly factor BamB